MSEMEKNIPKWLEKVEIDPEDVLPIPELPTEDGSDIEHVPMDQIIDHVCSPTKK